jgi:hypothetical protein
MRCGFACAAALRLNGDDANAPNASAAAPPVAKARRLTPCDPIAAPGAQHAHPRKNLPRTEWFITSLPQPLCPAVALKPHESLTACDWRREAALMMKARPCVRRPDRYARGRENVYLAAMREMTVPIPTRDDYALQLQVLRAWETEIARPRHADPKRLLRYGFKTYSQNDEDGIIQEIFRRIGAATRTFVEFGVERGVECNSAKLLVEGWRGLWIEARPDNIDAMRERFAPFLARDKLQLKQSLVSAENIDALLADAGMDGEIDLLAIDIDYNDYWVWKAVKAVRPRVVVIEYNASLRPPLSLTVPYDPEGRWDGSNFYGASLEALVRLGGQKGYRIVGCSIAGVNAFFVRDDLCADKFLEPSTAAEHYEPPRHFFHLLPAGHQARPGPFVPV